MNPLLEPDTEDSDEEVEVGEEISNPQLKEVLEFYDCYDLLPYANHILWLHTVKEAIGHIPFNLDFEAICCLVVLTEEIGKKSTFESQKISQKNRELEGQVAHRVPAAVPRPVVRSRGR